MYILIKQLKKTNPKLNNFLVKNRIRFKFLRNYKQYKNWKLNPIDDGSSLSNMFYWEETPEGIDFWGKLSDEYKK